MELAQAIEALTGAAIKAVVLAGFVAGAIVLMLGVASWHAYRDLATYRDGEE